MLDSAGKKVAEPHCRHPSTSVSGGTRGAIGYPRRMPAENSTGETQPPETCGHRGWIDVSVARPVSTSQQTGDGDVKPHQPSDEASQLGMEAQCHVGNDASEHSRNWILSGTFSQCSSRRSGVVCSDLLTKTSRAAVGLSWRIEIH